MKILQVNVVYKKGSTGKIVYDIHRKLQSKGIESIICYGRGAKVNEKNVYKTSSEIMAKFHALRSRITGLQYNGSFIATNRLIRIIKNQKPNIVHLHCLNGYFVNIYTLLKYLKKYNIKTVLTLHAEFMHTGSCSHAYECEKWKTGCGGCPQLWSSTKSYMFDHTDTAWVKMKNAFDGFDNLIVTSVSKWLQSRAEQSPILAGKKHFTVHNGIDTNNFRIHEYMHIKEKLGLLDEKIVLHVTANFADPIKGGKYVIELGERLKDKNIKIIIIGNSEKFLDFPKHIINIGRIENQKELATYYSMADITVVTSKRETFSLPCVESLCCGTPVVGFKAGAPEQISLPEFSKFVEFGNIKVLSDCIEEWIDFKKNNNVNVSYAQKYYSNETMLYSYMELYKSLLKDLNKES